MTDDPRVLMDYMKKDMELGYPSLYFLTWKINLDRSNLNKKTKNLILRTVKKQIKDDIKKDGVFLKVEKP